MVLGQIRWHVVAFVLGVAASSAACNSSVAGGSVDGAAVFAAACTTCHGATGKPPESMAAALRVRDLTGPEFISRRTTELVVHQIRAGSENKLMPSFEGTLSEAQVAAVAAFVMAMPAAGSSH